MASITLSKDDLVTKEQAADYLKISCSTLDRKVLNTHIIPVKVGTRVFVKKQDLKNFVDRKGFK